MGYTTSKRLASIDNDWADTPMTFTVNDSEGIKFPHSDALVISANIAEVKVRRILADGGSSVDLLFMHAFDQHYIKKTKAWYDPRVATQNFKPGELVL